MGKCFNCGEDTLNPKFCSRSCSVSSSNKISKVKNKNLNRTCENCGEEFIPCKSSRGKFCSQKCSSDKRVEDNFLDWYLYSKKFENRVLRNFLDILHGYSCSICGISDWNGEPITLEVEHKNGNSEDPSKDNVCLVCPNCHSQTPTYKGRNAGNGRHSRRLRYKQGKSY